MLALLVEVYRMRLCVMNLNGIGKDSIASKEVSSSKINIACRNWPMHTKKVLRPHDI